MQGAFAAHQRVLHRLGAVTAMVRTPTDLAEIDALIMPGGESTTMSKLLDSSGLFQPIRQRIADGMPVFGTCAGMILLATEALDGRDDQMSFAAIDLTVRRNGYGRQIDSFEADLAVHGLASSYHAIFVRAPRVERAGAGVEILAEFDNVPVLVREGAVFVASFHPELTNDDRVHSLFLQEVA